MSTSEGAVSRPILPESDIHPAVAAKVAGYHRSLVEEVQQAVAAHDIVVVGMAQNPHCGKARRALDRAGKAHHYLEYGSYLAGYRRRLALKMWIGWSTLPMVFVKGTFVGGASDLIALINAGELDTLLSA